MLTTVHGGDDDGIGVEVVTENLSRIGKLEDALTDLGDGAVNFVKEEKDRAIAGISQPVRRAESGHVAIGARQTNKVAFGHLRRAALNDRQRHVVGHLIDKLRLADTVATTEHEGLTHVENMGGDRNEGFEIDSHDTHSIIGRGFELLTCLI